MGKFKFNRDQLKRDLAQPRVAAGTHAMLIQEVKIAEKENGDYAGTKQLIVTQQSLSDPEDAGSTRGQKNRMYLDIPVTNPDVEGHQYPKWATSKLRDFFGAIGLVGELVYNKPEKSFTLAGEAVDKREVENVKLDLAAESVEKVIEMLEADDASEVVGKLYYVDVSYKAESNFPNFNRPRSELKDGESLIEGDGMEDPSGATEEAAAEEEAPAPAPAKAAPRAAPRTAAKKGKR